MKMVKKIVAATASVVMIVAIPGPANAEGYIIHIGDDCFVNLGSQTIGDQIGYPFLVRVPCPREVSQD